MKILPANIQSMFYVGETPWHNQGQYLVEPPKTSEEAIKYAKLDWTVKKVPLTVGQSSLLNHFGVIRNDTGENLGIVGKSYEPLQNIDAFNFFNPLLENNYAEYETAGAIGNGEIVWVMAKIKENDRFEVVKNDEIFKYLLLSNSHDGNMSVTIKFTPIRVVCQNTLNYALADGKGTKIRHLPYMGFKMSDAASNMISIINETYKEVEEKFKAMANKRLENGKEIDYFGKIYPQPGKKLIKTLCSLYEAGKGSDIANVRGTLWSAYNAVTEYVDHPQKYRHDDDQLIKRIWFGDGEAIKNKALSVAVDFLKSA